ncbi:MAG: hypothetical protein E6G80_03415 [Alphaproteobacteria bacterium]|nr:MAG: hypothetical protein E6G86_09510 [Alphaproteobacteria bacterium]TMJ75001.1 MAG: hypothetical protein E6G80_03415 [Alphaproteobacteria bacterium]TMK04571.1 MAG: hypothetical protein E6G74_02860 [Alphaproteobacteria bacterium]
MKKTLTALTAAGTMALATVATPTAADARWGWWGPALGAFAAGAIIGGALARPYSYGYYGGYYPAYSYSPYGYYPAYSYSYGPAYYGYAAAPGPYFSCWRYRYGYRYRVC